MAAFLVWLVIWRVRFKLMENVAGLTGLCLIVFAVALFLLGPNWLELAGAALETTLSSSYTLAQYFGWSWGKYRRPVDAARFHGAMVATLLAGLGILATGVDPVLVTELSVVFSAVALPLTYIPILVVANDPGYMGTAVNGHFLNALGTVYLGVILLAAFAAIPLMIVTGAGA